MYEEIGRDKLVGSPLQLDLLDLSHFSRVYVQGRR